MENSLTDKIGEVFGSFLNEIIKPHFPQAKYYVSETCISGIELSDSYCQLATNNLFEGTPYEVPNTGELIHFTSIHGLLSILMEDGIRLSPISNLDDSTELSYANSLHTGSIKTSIESNFKEMRNSLFLLSGQLVEHNTGQEGLDSYMWDTYGKRGKGVYLKLSYADISEKYAIGRVLYGTENLAVIEAMDIKANSLFQTNEIQIGHLGNFFSFIHPFHKSKRYTRENEIRLLFNGLQFSKENEVSWYSVVDANSNGDLISKLFIPFNSTVLDTPKIDITEIVFGYEFDEPKVRQYLEYFNLAFSQKTFKVGQVTNELKIVWYS